MRTSSVTKLAEKESVERFNQLVDSKLESVFNELQLLGRLTGLSSDDIDKHLVWRWVAFAGEIGAEAIYTKDDFVEACAQAFVDAGGEDVDGDDDVENDGEEP